MVDRVDDGILFAGSGLLDYGSWCGVGGEGGVLFKKRCILIANEIQERTCQTWYAKRMNATLPLALPSAYKGIMRDRRERERVCV